MAKGIDQLKDDLSDKAEKTGGSSLTQKQMASTVEKLAKHLHSVGYNITSADQLKEKHIESYANQRLKEVSDRTVKNELAHARDILKEAGKDKIANSDRISNQQLVGQTSREPARQPPDSQTREQIIAAASERDAGVGAALRLQAEFGLRAQEAVQACKSLSTWESQLAAGKSVTVVYGTKGGRPRETAPANRQSALQAVRQAQAVAQERGGKLVSKSTLSAAMSRFHNIAHQAGARGVHAPHSLRYVYTQAQVRQYQERGYSHHEARALTSQDLGHGDGRGRWVASVYASD